MRIHVRQPLSRVLTLFSVLFGVFFVGGGALAQAHSVAHISAIEITPITREAVDKATLRYAVAWNRHNPTSVCSASSPSLRRKFVASINNIDVQNGSPLSLVTTCAQAVTRIFIAAPSTFVSAGEIARMTKTIDEYAAFQVNRSTVILQDGAYEIVCVHGRWLFNTLLGS
jgi:hypothetical protein